MTTDMFFFSIAFNSCSIWEISSVTNKMDTYWSTAVNASLVLNARDSYIYTHIKRTAMPLPCRSVYVSRWQRHATHDTRDAWLLVLHRACTIYQSRSQYVHLNTSGRWTFPSSSLCFECDVTRDIIGMWRQQRNDKIYIKKKLIVGWVNLNDADAATMLLSKRTNSVMKFTKIIDFLCIFLGMSPTHIHARTRHTQMSTSSQTHVRCFQPH